VSRGPKNVLAERVVLDTNVLVAAAYAPHSASRQIVDACLAGELVPVASRQVCREYQHILSRAVRVESYRKALAALFDRLLPAEPSTVPRRVRDDPEDDKFLAVAEAGRAAWVVTSDRHLLELDPLGQIRILSPSRFLSATERG